MNAENNASAAECSCSNTKKLAVLKAKHCDFICDGCNKAVCGGRQVAFELAFFLLKA